jgi:hypothetical protein
MSGARRPIHPVHSKEAIMTANRSLLLALTVGVCAAVVYAVTRNSRESERKRLKGELRTWEGEGGNPAPSRTHSEAWPEVPV